MQSMTNRDWWLWTMLAYKAAERREGLQEYVLHMHQYQSITSFNARQSSALQLQKTCVCVRIYSMCARKLCTIQFGALSGLKAKPFSLLHKFYLMFIYAKKTKKKTTSE